jgi:hypothetical protein
LDGDIVDFPMDIKVCRFIIAVAKSDSALEAINLL